MKLLHIVLSLAFVTGGLAESPHTIKAYCDYDKNRMWFENGDGPSYFLALPGPQFRIAGQIYGKIIYIDNLIIRESWFFTIPTKYKASKIDSISIPDLHASKVLGNEFEVRVIARPLSKEMILGEPATLRIKVRVASFDELRPGGFDVFKIELNHEKRK